MLRWFSVAIALLFLGFASASSADLQVPPLTGRVVDLANILTDVQERQLGDRLATIEDKTGIQIVVVSLLHLGQQSIESWGLSLGRGWKIGRAGKDDGILVVLAPNDRQVRIEVGYGLEGKIPDAVANRIIQAYMLPAARVGNYASGLAATVDALARVISDPSVTSSIGHQKNEQLASGMVVLLGGCIVLFVFAIAWASTFRARTIYPPRSDEKSSSVFDDDNGGEHVNYSQHDQDTAGFGSLLDSNWSSSSGGHGFSGRGGSFGGGGATGKW